MSVWFGSLGIDIARIGLEAGPLSQWLYAAMKQAGLAVELLETRHVSDAFKAMPVKSDRNDARKIAQLMRLGWFRPVHCKSITAQEIRAMLTARKLVQSKLLDLENSLRGIVRGFGLKVGKTTRTNFARAIDDPSRFTSSKQAGPHFGLTPKKYQSGETDYTGRISKHGDASVREVLYEAAHIMLTKPIKRCSELKSWAMRIARRAGTNKAKVALARKLAVIMLRMLKDNVPFNPAAKPATA